MKCIIMAGGYATRMYPMTIYKSKTLLKIKDKTILDIIINNIRKSNNNIDEFIIVCNDTFYNDFIKWNNNRYTIFSDGSTSDADKIGVCNAFIKTINELKINDDVFLCAGDNIIDFSLDYFFSSYKADTNLLTLHYKELNNELLKKTGVAKIENNKIIDFEEKPNTPKYNNAIPPFYIFSKRSIALLMKYHDGSKTSFGEIIKILIDKVTVDSVLMNGNRYDVGNIDIYNELNDMVVQ